MDVRILQLFVFFLLVPGSNAFAFADYFLKFETSGATHDHTTLFSTDSNTWITVSIVDVSYPLYGPAHYPNTQIGAFTCWAAENTGAEYKTNVNHTKSYFAEVPRSLTILNLLDGTKTVITAGDGTFSFLPPATPAFLLPDGLLVTAGMSANWETDTFAIFMAATMAVRATAAHGRDFGIPELSTGSNGYVASDSSTNSGHLCAVGWAPSGDDGQAGEFPSRT